MITAFCAGGLRTSEVRNLDVDAFDQGSGILVVPELRMQGTRVVYLSSTAQQAFSDWIHARGTKSGPMFLRGTAQGTLVDGGRMTEVSIRRIIRRRCIQAGIRTYTPDDLRYTYLEYLRQAEIQAQRQLQVPYLPPQII
jgi:integrase